MNVKSLIVLACVIVAILALIFGVCSLLDFGDNTEISNETYPTTELSSNREETTNNGNQTSTHPDEEYSTENFQTDTEPEYTTSPDQTETDVSSNDSTSNDEPQTDLPPVVPVIPDNGGDSEKGEALTFPCKVEGYGLTIEKIAPYSGTFVEDGTNATVDGVAMLLIVNNGNFPVEYAQIKIQYENDLLLFDLTALPVGERMVVQEKNGKKIPDGDAYSATAMVLQEAELSLSSESVSVTDNGNNTLTVKNLTDTIIPTVRVFYKYYMEEENIFVGGISFTVRLTRMGAGESITIQPSHFTSNTSRVVMVLTYDSEV